MDVKEKSTQLPAERVAGIIQGLKAQMSAAACNKFVLKPAVFGLHVFVLGILQG